MSKETLYIRQLIDRMTLEQKIGALLTLGFSGTVPGPHIYEYITKYHCGGLRLSCDGRLFGNYVDPRKGNTVVTLENDSGIRFTQAPPTPTASQFKAVLGDLQRVARARPLGLPLHFSYDQEGGTSADFAFGGINIFPKPMGLRATGDPAVAYQVGRAVAEQSRAVGFNWIHSPVLDVNTDPRNPEIYTRAYSDQAEEVAEYAAESCRGLAEGGLIATAKHFPGRGHSDVDAHFQVPVIDVDRETMLARELLPYRALIEKGLLPSIMLAHSIFPAFDPDDISTVSRKIITGLLRETLGFDGVITTDSMTMGAIASRYGVANACAMSLEAGADLVLMKAENSLVPETIAAIREAVEAGRIPMAALDKKVQRVLGVKYAYGLFAPEREIVPEDVIGRADIRALAEDVGRRSVLIARDEARLLPLPASKTVLVIEQKVKHFNTFDWHSGILFEQCARLGGTRVRYLETDYTYDEEDVLRIQAAMDRADIIVATNYYIRGKLCNRDFWAEQIKHTTKPVIIVTNTPYEALSIPHNAGTVVVTFSTGPANIRATAGTLFGTVHPEGQWPLQTPLGSSRGGKA